MAILLPRPFPIFSIGWRGCSSALPPIFPIAVLGRLRCAVPANTDCADDGRPTNPVADAGRSRTERRAGILGRSPEGSVSGVSAQASGVFERSAPPLPSIAEDGRWAAMADAGLVEAGPPAIAEAGRTEPGPPAIADAGRGGAALECGNDAFRVVPDAGLPDICAAGPESSVSPTEGRESAQGRGLTRMLLTPMRLKKVLLTFPGFQISA
ncbi:hypothetical protein T484DRAFT_1748231 [Baffinella frigidus]|nr:hypothetical protein T484DRAFT_1748231 [Cryptophyta sp. CCMP2293]